MNASILVFCFAKIRCELETNSVVRLGERRFSVRVSLVPGNSRHSKNGK